MALTMFLWRLLDRFLRRMAYPTCSRALMPFVAGFLAEDFAGKGLYPHEGTS
jgi:hypothetical protein